MKYQLIKGEDFNYNVTYNGTDGIVQQIIFTDEVAPKDAELTDLSNDGDGSVVGWKKDGVYKVSTQVEGQNVIFNGDCKKMFADFMQLKEIDFSMIDTTHVTNLSRMFKECEELEKLDLSGFDTSNVTNMSEMFAVCESLENLNLSSFKTSNVSNMSAMFFDCSFFLLIYLYFDCY